MERTNSLAKAFRGEHLNETGEAILKKHGLFDQVEKLGLLRMETLEYCHNGQTVKTIKADPAVGHLGIHVPQVHLLQAITEEAVQYPNFHLFLNTTVKSLVQDENGHYTQVIALHNGEELTIDAALIVGADGRHSTIRKKLGLIRKFIVTAMIYCGHAFQHQLTGRQQLKWHLLMVCKFHCSHRQKAMSKLAGILKKVVTRS